MSRSGTRHPVPASRPPHRSRAAATALALALAVPAGVVLATGPASAATAPSNGTTFTISGVGSGKYLDVTGRSTADGAAVIQYTGNGGTNQRWTTRSAAGGGYTVVNVNSGRCLAVSGSSTAPGAAVVQQTCAAGAAAQTWLFTTTAAGISTVTSAASRLCLDVTGASLADGAGVVQWTCTGRANQQWALNPLGVTTVGVWGPGNNPGGSAFANQTVRQIVYVGAGGTAPRVRLSNLFGSGPLTVGHVDVAVQATGGTAVAGSHRRVTFGGAGSVTLAVGQERLGDPVAMTVAAGTNLLVSIHVANALTASTWHAASYATTWVSTAGDHAAEDGTGNFPTTRASWYLLGGVQLSSATATGTLVAFGDSITDGAGGGTNTNNRYPDHLARRLAAVPGGPRLAVVNAGIGGNRLLTDAGNSAGYSALRRFSRDALGHPNVRNVILLEGVNDLLHGDPTAQQLIDGYRTLIGQARAAGVAIHGGTIVPCGGYSRCPAAKDGVRTAVNAWIRTSGAFDSVVDFDAVLRDPADVSRLQARYDSGDRLHPNAAGYQAMANAVNLAALRY